MIKCKHCDNWTNLPEAGARNIGWRLFNGLSLTGKPLGDVLCPVCSGRGEDPKMPTWNIECTTCEWNYIDEEDWQVLKIPINSAEDADKIARDHKCEPWFIFTDPQGTKYDGENQLYKRRIWPKLQAKMEKTQNRLDQDSLPLDE